MAWTIVMGALGFISMIVFFICFKGTKERVKPIDKNPVPVKKALPLLLKNKFWYIVLLVNLLGQITTGLTGVNVFFAKYWLGDENMVGMLSIVMMLPMVIGLFAASPFISKFGKRNCIITGSIISAVGMVAIMLDPSTFIFVMIGMFIKGLGMGVNSAATMILIADVIDYGEWKNGVRSDGIAYSAQSFGAKLGAGIGAAALGWGLAWGSYNADLAIQSAGAMNAILIIFAVVPLIINVLTIVLLSFYSLDKKLPQIRKELEERRTLAISTQQS
jgi:GPH family glycoside/pentoside/hexuronide:cation symporter